MPDLMDLRDLIGDSKPPYFLPDATLVRFADRNAAALYATAAELRDHIQSRKGPDLGKRWNDETTRLRNIYNVEATGGGFVGGKPSITTVDTTVSPAADPLVLAAVRDTPDFDGSDFNLEPASGAASIPEFDGEMYVGFAISWTGTVTRIALGGGDANMISEFLQRGGFLRDGAEWLVWRSTDKLFDSVAGVRATVS